MKKIELLPLKGIRINGTDEINLGSKITEVERILGKPSSTDRNNYYYDDIEVRMDFDRKNKLEFIEFIEGPFSDKIELSIYGVNPFSTPAKELIEILLKNGNNNIDDSEAEYAYTFPNISVGVWRDLTEEVVNNTIKELKENGEYEKSREWIENDLLKSKYFWTIGIGIKDYYDN